MRNIGIIGAGAWGTALAIAMTRANNKVTLWSYEEEVARAINEDRLNYQYLPEFQLSEAIQAITELSQAVDGCDLLLLATPAQFMRSVCEKLAPCLVDTTVALISSKGIESETHALMSEVVSDTLPQCRIGILSGPSFAEEVAGGQPTAVTLAIEDQDLGRELLEVIGSQRFRPYLSADIIGAQIGGALKNVLAIACGIAEGKGFGENTRMTLITRGLAEITRLGCKMGAEPQTLMGLSGIGDLVLTSSSRKSRNFSVGLALGRGQSLQRIRENRQTEMEGVDTVAAAMALARKHSIEMPICKAVDDIVNHHINLDQIIEDLLNRPFTREI